MGSRPTLWALFLVAGILGGVLGIDLLRSDAKAAIDRRVVPELADSELSAVLIEPSDSPRIRLVRGGDGRLSIVEPVRTLVSADAQDELVFTLRRLSFQRRLGETLSEPRATVDLELGGDRVRLSIGAPIEATGQVWIGRSDRKSSYIVDDYAAAVLLRGVDQLRERSVWSSSPRRASRIEISAQGKRVALAGPRAEIAGISARADSGALIRVASMLDRLRFESFQSPVPPGDGGVQVHVEGNDGTQQLTELGPCTPTLVLVAGPVGTGCVDRATVDSLRETALGGRALWDRDLFSGVDTESITLAAGTLVETIGTNEPRARQWLARLRSATGDQWIDTPGVPPVANVSFSQRDGSRREVDIYRGPIAARRGETVALRLDLEVAPLLEPGPNLFRSRALIERDPSEVARIAVAGGVVVERGQLVGEWNITGPEAGPANAARVGEVARTLAQLTALEFVEGELGAPTRVIELSLDATPLGVAAATRTLSIATQCRATLDGDPTVFILPKDACASLQSTWWR